MAKVTYKPEPGTPAEHTQYGIAFGTKPVEVNDPSALAKLRGNPFYDVEGEDGPAEVEGLKATHNGGGRFIIVWGDGDDDVIKGLDKADAAQFNALSDTDKAAYVEAHKAPAE
jgi:hypothetical protein